MPVNKVIYGDRTLIDLQSTTLDAASKLLNNVTAYDRTGTVITGTALQAESTALVAEDSAASGGIIKNITTVGNIPLTVVDTLDENGGTIRSITADNVINLEYKPTTVHHGQSVVTPDTGYDGMSKVAIEAQGSGIYQDNQGYIRVSPYGAAGGILYKDGYISLLSSYQNINLPTETKQIMSNGIYDITNFATANVNVTRQRAGYTQLEKVKGVANAKIDTGIQPNNTTYVELKVKPLQVTGNAIFGTGGANDSSDWRLFNNNSQIYFDYWNKRLNGSTFAVGTIRELKIENGKVTDIPTNTVLLSGTAVSSFTVPYDIYINGNGTNSTTQAIWYYVKIYHNGELVRDFVPCVRDSDGICGFYDLRNDQFYASSGSADFVRDDDISLQAKTNITPTTASQTVTADSGYDGLSSVQINAIPSQYIVPSGSLSITSNNTYDVTNYASAVVNVGGSSTLTTKSITANGTYNAADDSADGYSSVTVTVPTGTARTSADLTASGATVTVPAGLYSEAATKTITSGSATTPSTSITANPSFSLDSTTGVVTATTSASKSVTPTVSAGYVSSGTAGTVSVSGSNTYTIPAASVRGAGLVFGIILDEYMNVDNTGLVYINTTYTTGSDTPVYQAGWIGTDKVIGSSISLFGQYQLSTQAATTITPTESSQTAVAAGKYTTGAVTVGAISSTYVGSGITQRTSSDLTTSGATVTAPAGYYASAASASVSSMTLPTAASSSSSGSTNKATIGRSTSAQYINIPAGYNASAAYYTISATPNGAVTAPSSISGTSATVSTGTNTLTLTKTVSVTPNVTTAGYISSGTAGNSSVSLTASVTTKAAATITPGTTNQTIASGTYLTGTQTISGDANLVASNILSGVSIFGVSGSVTFANIYSGSSAPSSSQGSNGDIYIQTS